MKDLLYILSKPFLLLLFGMLSILILTAIVLYIFFSTELKDKNSIMNYNNGGITLLDRNSKEFFTFYQPKQTTFVPLSEIPHVFQQAVISSEDKEFYQHAGFSIKGLGRAILTDIQKKDTVYGGSTITQQLVKNAILSPQKNFLRKYEEIVLAFELERRFNKNDILEMYLNSVYFGEGAFGVENASETYFNKHANALTLSEATMLVGLLPSPSTLSPLSNGKEGAKQHQQIVLQEMVKDGVITQDQAIVASNQQLTFNTAKKQDTNAIAPHFALMVKDFLVQKYGEQSLARSGFKIKTTLDLDGQLYAEQIVRSQVARLNRNKATNGATVVMDPKTGEVLALVGSHDWYDESNGKINMAITSRQPGSSFKPIVYAAALSKHLITPATVLQDVPTTFDENYKPLDFDKSFRGPVLVRRALANSLNIPAVEVMQKVGVSDVLNEASTLGITTLGNDSTQYGLSLVLGAGEVKLLELTNVYATFANQGMHNDPTLVLEITDKNDKSIYHYDPNPQQVLDPNVAFLISSILSDNNARAEEFGSLLTISRQAAVKTGTSEEFTNALTFGYTPSLSIGAWVGNNDASPMDNVAGSLGAAPIWKNLMGHFLVNTPVEKFQKPSGVSSLFVCRDKGLVAHTATSSAYTEFFLQGTEPTQNCNGEEPSIQPQNLNVTLTPTNIPVFTPTETPIPIQIESSSPTPTQVLQSITIPPLLPNQ